MLAGRRCNPAPADWNFIRKLDAGQSKQLHPTTLTSLFEQQQAQGAIASSTLVPLRATAP